jgi:four helix bundle protein
LHKTKIVLKELRETHVSLKIIDKADLYIKDIKKLHSVLNECNELISIFVATTKTAGPKF